MISKHQLTFGIVALLTSFGAEAAEAAPLLKGRVVTESPVKVEISYDFEGDPYHTTLITDSLGNFTFDSDLPIEETPVEVSVASLPYGAFIKKGTTTEMTVDGKAATFSGDNVAESKWFNQYCQAYYPYNYKPNPDFPFVYEEYMMKLNEGRDKTMKLASKVKKGYRSTAKRMTDASYDRYHIQLMGIDRGEGKTDHREEMKKLIGRIDPNDDISRHTGLLQYWYNNSGLPRKTSSNDIVEILKDQYALIDSALTNMGNKKAMYRDLGRKLTSFGIDKETLTGILDQLEPQLKYAPKIKEEMLASARARAPKVKKGESLPSDPKLIDPEGHTCTLSSILGGKVIYIDIWATWCAPCCREIPYVEKLVEKYKDNDQIAFVSISEDSDSEKWHKKLLRDHPDWPQYILENLSGEQFLDSMSIHSIPRFLLVGKDGTFISTDAPRPSAANIEEFLNEAIASQN